MTQARDEKLIEHATLLASGGLLARREIEWRARELAEAFLSSRSHAQANGEPGRIPELEPTRINAEYWRAAASKDGNLCTALLAMEQAANAWENAAYAAHDKLDATIKAHDTWAEAAHEAQRLLTALSAAAAPSPIGGFTEVLAEYDRIVYGGDGEIPLDARDAEADFVMRGSDWRVIREALSLHLADVRLPSNGCVALNYMKMKKALTELVRLYDWRNELGRIERDFNHDKKQMSRWLNQYGREKKQAWHVARDAFAGAPDIDVEKLHARIQFEAQRSATRRTAEKIIEDYIDKLLPEAPGITHLRVALAEIRRADGGSEVEP